jgi:cell division protein FtsB
LLSTYFISLLVIVALCAYFAIISLAVRVLTEQKATPEKEAEKEEQRAERKETEAGLFTSGGALVPLRKVF